MIARAIAEMSRTVREALGSDAQTVRLALLIAVLAICWQLVH
jgi:hypothetical protein